MIKKVLFSISMCSMVFSASAQEPCATGRYAQEVFPNVTTTSDIVYGANLNFSGSTKILKLDFYEPTGDAEPLRPLIIWVHGGSFLGGSKTDGDMVSLSNKFAKMGYACASIDYRTGFFPIDSANSVKAVLRAVHDLKAAVRYFYKDQAEGSNTYKVDTNNIFIGGSSAGAITALHYAYLDRTCELEEYLGLTYLQQQGGTEGISGNPCYGTDVKGVINLCGALARYKWLEAGDIPFVSVHGTNDATVGYNRQIVNPGVPLMYLDGSRMLYERATQIGVQNPFYTFYDAGHVPHASSAQYMDTTVNFVRDFLIDQLGCTNPPLQAANAPVQTATLYPLADCTTNTEWTACTSLGENELMDYSFNLYPNPAVNSVNLEFASEEKVDAQLIDLSGRVRMKFEKISSGTDLNVSELENGVYWLVVSSGMGQQRTLKLAIQK